MSILEISATILYWLAAISSCVIICKNQEWIPWNKFNLWECFGVTFLFAASLALISWALFIILVWLYRKVKRCNTNETSGVVTESIHIPWTASECVIDTLMGEGAVGGEDGEGGGGGIGGGEGGRGGGGGESQRPSRSAPSLPPNKNKSAVGTVPKTSKGKGSEPPPPSYEEVYKMDQV